MSFLSAGARAALVIVPLTLGGCSMMGDQSGSPTNGGATQSTGVGGTGPSSTGSGAGSAGSGAGSAGSGAGSAGASHG